jgi:hypothetical protein
VDVKLESSPHQGILMFAHHYVGGKALDHPFSVHISQEFVNFSCTFHLFHLLSGVPFDGSEDLFIAFGDVDLFGLSLEVSIVQLGFNMSFPSSNSSLLQDLVL